MITDCATADGTKRFSKRHEGKLFRPFDDLFVSAIGLGTYLGDHNDRDDQLYEESIELILNQGCNLIDTAINYRCMHSERNIGKVLKQLIDKKKIRRDEIVICTKGGFIPFDGHPPENIREYFDENFVKAGLCRLEDIAAGCHCLEPRYIENQILKSLQNLGLETIDLYYLHNPETQLEKISSEEFETKLEKAFEALEKAVSEKKIVRYGLATWNGLRQSNQLSLEKCFQIAEKVGGSRHHLKAIQLPFNLAMIEAYGEPIQQIRSEKVSPLEAAQRLKLAVFSSASILQGKILGSLPSSLQGQFPDSKTDAQRALQFVLSTPGITAALVGMKRKGHVQENLQCLTFPILPPSGFRSLFAG
ncbi:MAG: aldo/keto reductase [Deltaproteobacteria bacterium]|nr:aldo/keto reductase [Deltaproteobacteria bacterium]